MQFPAGKFLRLSPFLLLVLAPGCGGGGGGGGYSAPPPPPPNTITVGGGVYMTDNIFTPATLNVNAGTTVTWTWAASGHTVDSGTSCAPDGAFSSGGVRGAGYSMTHQFTTAGTYNYYCTTHCGMAMTGVVIVH